MSSCRPVNKVLSTLITLSSPKNTSTDRTRCRKVGIYRFIIFVVVASKGLITHTIKGSD